MNQLKRILALALLVCLLSAALLSCDASGDGNATPTDPPAGGDPAVSDPPAKTPDAGTTEAATTVLPDPSPSLGSPDEIVKLGISYGDIILEGAEEFGGGSIYGGLNEAGEEIWALACDAPLRIRDVAGYADGLPTLYVNGIEDLATIGILNRTPYEVTREEWYDENADYLPPNTAPTETGVYFYSVNVNKSQFDLDYTPEVDEMFGTFRYFFRIVILP